MSASCTAEPVIRQIVEAMRTLAGPHPGFRPVHAKGLVCSGTFRPSAQTTYFAEHAFRFTAADGTSRFGRYRFVPQAGEAFLSPDEAGKRSASFLSNELDGRLRTGPVAFRLLLQVAERIGPTGGLALMARPPSAERRWSRGPGPTGFSRKTSWRPRLPRRIACPPSGR